MAEAMNNWASQNGMSISAPKSTVTLFTPWTKQVNAQLDVKVGGDPIPKLLGVTLDPTFSFAAHSTEVARKAASHLNLLRALSDTSFGKDKECLISTFKLYIRSVIDYAAPVVYPN